MTINTSLPNWEDITKESGLTNKDIPYIMYLWDTWEKTEVDTYIFADDLIERIRDQFNVKLTRIKIGKIIHYLYNHKNLLVTGTGQGYKKISEDDKSELQKILESNIRRINSAAARANKTHMRLTASNYKPYKIYPTNPDIEVDEDPELF